MKVYAGHRYGEKRKTYLWVGLFLPDTGDPVLVSRYIKRPEGQHPKSEELARKIAEKELRMRWPGESVIWLDTVSPEHGIAVERTFAAMQDSVAHRYEQRLGMDEWKRLNKLNHDDLLWLARRDGLECCWCGRETVIDPPHLRTGSLPPDAATIEHVVPVSKRGTRSFRNLRIACYKCNTERGNLDRHPIYELRPKPECRYPDKIIMHREFELPTEEDWEPTEEGVVKVSVALSGKSHRWASIYVKGGGVWLHYRVPNTGPEALEHVLALAERLPKPVTFEGLEALGFTYIRYMERKKKAAG